MSIGTTPLTEGAPLIRNLFRKRDLLRQRDPAHRSIRTVLLILSGGNLGVYGSGAAVALHRMGFGDVFDTVVGVSIGAGIGGYFLAGEQQMKLGSSIYYTEFAGERFINFRRVGKIVDVGLISEVMRRGRAKMDEAAILASRSEFFVGVTNARTGVGELLDAKRVSPDVITAIEASTAIPLGSNPPVLIDGRLYFDGGTGLPYPLSQVVERFHPTDVLVLPNRIRDTSSDRWFELADTMYASLMLRSYSAELRSVIPSRHRRFWEEADAVMQRSDVNVGVLWPPDHGIGTMTRDARRLRGAVEASAAQTFSLFGMPGLDPELL